MTLICIFGDFFQMVEFTAISSIFTDFLSFARKRILTEYMYTHSLMVVIHLLHRGKDYIEQLLAKMKEIGVGKIASLRDVTMQWTEITTGIVFRRLMIHSLRVKA